MPEREELSGQPDVSAWFLGSTRCRLPRPASRRVPGSSTAGWRRVRLSYLRRAKYGHPRGNTSGRFATWESPASFHISVDVAPCPSGHGLCVRQLRDVLDAVRAARLGRQVGRRSETELKIR